MKRIKYRPIKKCDDPAVCKILSRAFGLAHYIPEPGTLKYVEQQYLYSCLSEATYTCVAEQDGLPVGVIMGCAKNSYRLLPHLRYLAATLFYELQVQLHCASCRTGVQDYRNLHRIYRSFSQKHKGEFDGVLTLFAVEESCRGLGVGKSLLSGLLAYLQKQGTRRIYLYTDTTCNVGFYEHQGFRRLDQTPLELTRDGKPFQMDVYLYDYRLNT